jgi:hypothetical protein
MQRDGDPFSRPYPRCRRIAAGYGHERHVSIEQFGERLASRRQVADNARVARKPSGITCLQPFAQLA